MKLHDKIITQLENLNFSVDEVMKQDGMFYVEIERSTPLGEDWIETVWFDGTNNGFIEAVREIYYDFDVDEEVEIWIKNRGQNGVPNSIKALVDDAEWKEYALEELVDALDNLDMED